MNRLIIVIACITTVLLTSCGNATSNYEEDTYNSNESNHISQNNQDEADSVLFSKGNPTSTSLHETTTISTNIFSGNISASSEKFITSDIDKTTFTKELHDIDITITDTSIHESGIVNGQNYSFTIELSNWDHNTTPEQMVTLSRLFWQCYPKMYERYHDLCSSQENLCNVILAIENNGYEIAEGGTGFIHLHDMWLFNNPFDYDCITHELAHLFQDRWIPYYLEYNEYIELFADCCRYEYALDNGYYNDSIWLLQTADTQHERKNSVRFLVWLDYMFSNENVDIMRNYFDVCCNMMFSKEKWNEAWQQIFLGTEVEGKSIEEVWNLYMTSDFAFYSSLSNGDISDLLSVYPVRDKLSKHENH